MEAEIGMLSCMTWVGGEKQGEAGAERISYTSERYLPLLPHALINQCMITDGAIMEKFLSVPLSPRQTIWDQG